MRTEGSPWGQLYEPLRILWIAYKNPGGFGVNDIIGLYKMRGINLSYQRVYHRLQRMSFNGLLQKEHLPRETSGGRAPISFYISKSGISRVEKLRRNNVYQDDYPKEKWSLW